jgi:PEP-CTERM motif
MLIVPPNSVNYGLIGGVRNDRVRAMSALRNNCRRRSGKLSRPFRFAAEFSGSTSGMRCLFPQFHFWKPRQHCLTLALRIRNHTIDLMGFTTMTIRKLAIGGAMFALSVFGSAQAAVIPYPTPGVENPNLYSFIATGGNVTAYFAGSSAGFTNLLGLRVNGVDSGINGLNNQTSAIGDSLSFGAVAAGSSLVFYIDTSAGDRFFSNRALNSDGVNHVYSVAYDGIGLPPIIPLGTFVAFEDLRGGGDLNYNDHTFVFTNVTNAVPEPSTWAMMILGFVGLGWTWSRRSRAAVAV